MTMVLTMIAVLSSSSYAIFLQKNDITVANRIVDIIEKKIEQNTMERSSITNAIKNIIQKKTLADRVSQILQYVFADLTNDVICVIPTDQEDIYNDPTVDALYHGSFDCGIQYRITREVWPSSTETALAQRYATLYDQNDNILMEDFPLMYVCGDYCTPVIMTDKDFETLARSQTAWDVCWMGYEYYEYDVLAQSYTTQVSYRSWTSSDDQPHLTVTKGDQTISASFIGLWEEQTSFDGISVMRNGNEERLYGIDPLIIQPAQCGLWPEEQPDDVYDLSLNNIDYRIVQPLDKLTFVDPYAIITLDLETMMFDVE